MTLSIPEMPIHIAFLKKLEFQLISLLSTGSQQVLEQAVPCICSILTLTEQYQRLEVVLTRCFDFLNKLKADQAVPIPPATAPVLFRCLLLTSLIIRYYSRSNRRQEGFDLTMHFMSAIPKSQVPLIAWGHISLGTPTLFVTRESMAMIQEVLDGSSEPKHMELVKVFITFLESQNEKVEEFTKSTKVDMKVLLGHGSGFSESGISSALMQTFLDPLLGLMLIPHIHLARLALRIIMLSLEQGLVHPILVFIL